MNRESEMRIRELYKLAYSLKHKEEKRVKRLARKADEHGCSIELIMCILYEYRLLRQMDIDDILERKRPWKYAFINERD